jgi:titin
VTRLVNGDSYVFAVDAMNAAGIGVLSAPSTVATPRSTPGAPTKVTALAHAHEITVSWRAPSNSGGGLLLGYRIFVGERSSKESTVPVNRRLISTLTFTFHEAQRATYFIIVRAVNVVGQGQSSHQTTSKVS